MTQQFFFLGIIQIKPLTQKDRIYLLILPVACLFQILSRACLRTQSQYSETEWLTESVMVPLVACFSQKAQR